MLNKLQFLHTREERIFPDKIEALNYLINKSEKQSLYAEPLIMRYGTKEDNNLLLIIGASGNGVDENKDFFVIDHAQVLKDLTSLDERLDEVEISAHVTTEETPSLKLDATKGETSTIVKGDVKLGKYDYIDGEADPTKKNILKINEDGLFTYVDIKYENNKLIFAVNDKVTEFPMSEEDYVVNCAYDVNTESLVLTRKSGEEVKCNLSGLIQEWTVEGESSKTPIVLTRERVIRDKDTNQYQDVLRGNIRIADDVDYNILKVDRSSRGLYVEGTASNIMYDETTTVKKAIDNKYARVSNDDANLLFNKIDGIYANVNLTYDSTKNTLTFTRSKHDGTLEHKDLPLAGVELIDHIDYHSSTKILEIYYKDNTGKVQKVSINMGDMLASIDWIPQNDGHTVAIHKTAFDNTSNQQVSADVKIAELDDNILTEVAHHLYVKGTANNIQFDPKSTVEDVIKELQTLAETLGVDLQELIKSVAKNKENIESNTANIDINADAIKKIKKALKEEIERAQECESVIKSGVEKNSAAISIINDEVENIKADVEQNKTDIASLTTNMGEGFSVRYTVADAIKAVTDTLKSEAETARDAEGALGVHIENVESQVTNNTEDIAQLKKDTKIKITNLGHNVKISDDITEGHNLSADVEISKTSDNIIQNGTDGIYASVDLSYEPTTNVLTFQTSDGTKKELALLSNSLVKRIYYDPVLESIIFVYVINGQEQTMAVSVRGLIDEWDVKDTDTIKLTKELNASSQGEPATDVLSADIIICPANIHADNILKKDNGLYVSGKQIDDNTKAIEGLTDSVTDIESRLQTVEGDVNTIKDEIVDINIKIGESATESEIQDLNGKLAQEIQDRKDGDASLQNAVNVLQDNVDNINSEIGEGFSVRNTIADAINANADAIKALNTTTEKLAEKDEELESSIKDLVEADKELAATDKEIKDIIGEGFSTRHTVTDAIAAINERETVIETKVSENAVALEHLRDADKALAEIIADEERNREKADDTLKKGLMDYTDEELKKIARYTFEDTPTVNLTLDENSKVTADVLVANGNDNIIKTNTNDVNGVGLYATANLNYDAARNTLTFETTNGSKEITLNAGSIIDNMEVIDKDGIKYIKIFYHTTDGATPAPLEINVNDLLPKTFVEKVTVENTPTNPLWLNVKDAPSGTSVISGQILISKAHSDNMLTIDGNNGLYVPGTAISGLSVDVLGLWAKMDDLQKEIDNIETGSGLNDDGTYKQSVNEHSNYLTTSTSLTNSDIILDGKIAEVSGNVTNIQNKIDGLDFTAVTEGDYVKWVRQTDGQITAETGTFDQTIDENDTHDATPSSKAVYDFVTAYTQTTVEGLDFTGMTKTNGAYVDYVQQIDGVVSATTKQFDQNIDDKSTSGNIPSSYAVYEFVTSHTPSFSSLTSNTFSGDYINWIVENDGIISAKTGTFDQTIDSGSTSGHAPSSYAVYNYVQSAITEQLDGLDFSGITKTDGEYVNYVGQTDGKVSATTKSFDQSINSDSTSGNIPSSYAVYQFVKNNSGTTFDVSGLSASTIGGNAGQYIYAVGEKDGIITASANTFDTVVSSQTSGSTKAPTTKAVYTTIAEVERVTSKAINKLRTECGFDENGNYIPKEGSPYIGTAGTLTEAIDALDTYIQACDATITAETGKYLAGFGQIDAKITTPTFVEFNNTLDISGQQAKVAPSTEAVNNALYWKLEDGNTDTIVTKNNYKVKAEAFYETSDATLKHNIAAIDNADVEKVATIELKEYALNADASETKKYGVIAQELESAGLENLVHTDNEGKKSVDYISLLILKIQQLENEIKELKNNK